ncbi:MAG TPA: hypothetical protein VJ733_09265 [Candidatus Binatia bacterium]|nr:hypothetical protein [Candidatus Binatia bacterium]
MNTKVVRVLYGLIFAAALVLGLDIASGYFLFFYQNIFATTNIWAPGGREYLAYSPGATPIVSVMTTLADHIRATRNPPSPAQITGDDFRPLLSRDEELGWSARPGSYNFVFGPADVEGASLYHDWSVTIREDGSRATSRKPVDAPNALHVFGDSWIFGWGLDDEFTLGWQLQSEFRDRFRVSTHASGGWGHLQGLINFRRIKSELTRGDIVLFGYAQFLLPRNAPHPSVIASLAEGLASYAERPDRPLLYPRATVSGGKIDIDLLPLDCARVAGYCDQPDFSLEEIEDITMRIFDEIIDSTEATLILLHMDGPDDRVIQHLRSRNVTIVDGRPPADLYVHDTMAPYDAHPGPINNHYWFTKLRPEIDRLIQAHLRTDRRRSLPQGYIRS